jgi:hypothetical protein
MYNILGELKTNDTLKPYKFTKHSLEDDRKCLVLLKDIAETSMLPIKISKGKRTGKTVYNVLIHNKRDSNDFLNMHMDFKHSKCKAPLYIKYLKEDFNITLCEDDNNRFISLIDYTTSLPQNLFMKKKNYRKYKCYRKNNRCMK